MLANSTASATAGPPSSTPMGCCCAVLQAALQLEYYATNWLHSPSFMQALSFCSRLAHLRFVHVKISSMTTTWANALARLTALESLKMIPTEEREPAPASLVAALQQLQGLTQLKFTASLCEAQLLQLPTSLEVLEIELYPQFAWGSSKPRPLQFSHLCRLEELTVTAPGGIYEQSTMPASLDALLAFEPMRQIADPQVSEPGTSTHLWPYMHPRVQQTQHSKLVREHHCTPL